MTPAERARVRRLQRLPRFISMAVFCLLAVAFAVGRVNAQIMLPGAGSINTVAGNGTPGYNGNNIAALQAELYYPSGVALDGSGNVYIADKFNSVIWKINATTGVITIVAGEHGQACSTPTLACGDGGSPLNANLNYPTGVAVDGSGNIYIADTSDNRIREVMVSENTIATIAGTGNSGYNGDNINAKTAELNLPSSVAVDGRGNVYIADTSNNRIREVAGGIITPVAGSSTACSSPTAACGDHGAATSAQLHFPNGVALDSFGNIYIADTSDERIREVANGTITTIAGNGTICSPSTAACGDGGTATSANLGYPWGITFDSSGNLYIADSNDNRVRAVYKSGQIPSITNPQVGYVYTVAGTGTVCSSPTLACGDSGGAVYAQFNGPEDVAVDASKNLYIVDTSDSRIRAVGAGSAPPAPALPTFSPAAGRYLIPQTVTISDSTNGATVYYTTDGSTPTTSSTQYTAPISVSSSETINAIAVSSVASGGVATAAYIIGTSPTFSPVGGTYASAQTVSITSTDFGATIYYTTNGTTPTTSSTRYTGPIGISSTETIKAIAVSGAASSSVSTAMYTINLPAPALTTATITVSGSEQPGDSNSITISFNGFRETVNYGSLSTQASIASAFGAKFSNDYLHAGLCAYGSGSTITFKLRGGAAFGTLDVEGSTVSFQLHGTGFATQVVKTVDTGTVTLTVGGVLAAQTNYGDGATPSAIAEGLAANATSGSLVSISAADENLYLVAKQPGAGTDYSYTLQTTSWDSTDFTQPSFASPAINGNLDGGANTSSGGSQQTVYSYSIPSYVLGQQPTGYDANGNIVDYTDSVMGGWGFSYDPLSRLISSSTSTGAYAGLQTSWGYDPFGNRQSETFSGTTGMPMPTSSTASYNTLNQISSSSLMLGAAPQYDAAGDVTQDNQYTYLYDGEGRVCAIKNMTVGSMTGYIYDAGGTRVSTGTITTWGSCDPSVNGYQATKDSIMGPSGGQLTETGLDVNGNVVWAHTNVFVGGALIATYDANGIHFYLNDWNSSRRVQTDYESVVEQTCMNLPYGNGESCGNTPSEYLFAGLQQEDNPGLENATYRQYASFMGLWNSPDPYAGSYNWANPQSLNRYAYVGGNPLAMTDPSGQDPFIGLYDNIATDAQLFGSTWDYWLNSLAPIVPFLDAADLIYNALGVFQDFGQAFGWWGGSPFHGNVAASQSLKNVPGSQLTSVPTVPGMVAYPNASVYYNGGNPYSPGSYNLAVTSFSTPEFGSIEPMSKLQCADYRADRFLSIASMTSGDSPDNPVVQTFLGNSFSGLGETIRNRSLFGLAIGGWNPGVPGLPSPKIGRLPIDGGLSGMVSEALLGGASDLFFVPKGVYDLATYVGAFAFECQGSPW
jgi:RHS repeat-associated protein